LGDAIGLAPLGALAGVVVAALILRRRASELAFPPVAISRPPHN
jgi:hypothetical protein